MREFEELDLLRIAQKVNAKATNLRRLKRLSLIPTLGLLKWELSDQNYTKNREFEGLNSGKSLVIRGSAPVT